MAYAQCLHATGCCKASRQCCANTCHRGAATPVPAKSNCCGKAIATVATTVSAKKGAAQHISATALHNSTARQAHLLHVIPVRQAQVLLGCDVAQQSCAQASNGGGTDGRGDVVVGGGDVGCQGTQGIEGRLTAGFSIQASRQHANRRPCSA